MGWRQEQTVRFDFSAGGGGARVEELIDTLPDKKPARGSAMFVFANRGTGTAFLVTAADIGNIENTPFEIPAGATREGGPFQWGANFDVDDFPKLNGAVDADVFVVPLSNDNPAD